ncbi:MAG: hypothetical protein ACK5IB_09435 [Qingshengfaniella sp.]
MKVFRVLRAAALPCSLLLAGCVAPGTSTSEVDVSQLVQTAPADLRVVDILPRGLGSGGEALLLIEISDDNPDIASSESFELTPTGETYDAENRRTIATYSLSRADQRRFTEMQVKIRAQLLAGYAQVRLAADSAVCDEAGVELVSGTSPLMVQNAATGRTIYTVMPDEPLATIKDRVPFCT